MKQLIHRFKIIALSFFSLMCIQKNTVAKSYDLKWVNGIGGSQLDNICSIKIDGRGNIYSIGMFNDTIDFDPGPGSFPLVASSLHSLFISKTDNAGNAKWTKSIHGTFKQSQRNTFTFAMDALSNMYILCAARDTVDFDPGPGSVKMVGQGYDFFILKLDSTGSFIWVKQIDGGSNLSIGPGIIPGEIAVSNGNIYVTGTVGRKVDSVDLDPGPAINKIPAPTSSGNMFALKLDTSGSFIWAKAMISPTGTAIPKSIAVDPQSNLLITGSCAFSTVDFDPGPDTANLPILGTANDFDVFILKLNDDGDFVWVKSFGGPDRSNDQAYAIATDVHGNVYTTGEFADVSNQGMTASFCDFDPGPNNYILATKTEACDMFISKLNSKGEFVWAKQIGGDTWDRGNAISVSNAGIVYITGSVTATDILGVGGTIDIDPGIGIYNVATPQLGSMHHSIIVLDTSGNFISGHLMGPLATQGLGYYTYAAISHDADGNIYLGGEYDAQLPTTDFDPSANVAMVNYAGNKDIFLLKMSPCIMKDTTSIVACDSVTFQGQTYTATGFYHRNNTSVPGTCDSVLTLNITLGHIPGNTVTQNGVALTATATNANYQWVDCDNGYSAISGANGKTFTPAVDGNYALVVSGGQGCSDTSVCFTVTGTGVSSFGNDFKVIIYPNPANDIIYLKAGKELQDVSIRLVDVLGHVLSENKHQNGISFAVAIDKYPAGIYTIEIQKEGRIARYKVTKL